MSLRTVSRSAIGGYVKLLRLPLDASVGLRARNGASGPSAGTIAIDRFEARLRRVAGKTLRDEELVRDAERRRLAADERQRSLDLRTEAQKRSQHAEERLSEKESQAEQQRRAAARRSADRKKRAVQQRKAESRRIAEIESRRRRANEKATVDKEEEIEDRSKRARLQQLDEEADALAKRQGALTARNESERLRSAAIKAKAARKRPPRSAGS
jgi:colicin import membrane protein